MDAGIPDEEVVRILVHGDDSSAREAFDVLLSRYGPQWRAMCNRYAGGTLGGEEVFQAASLKIWERRRVIPHAEEGQWLKWFHTRMWWSGSEYRRRRMRPDDAADEFDESAISVDGASTATPFDCAAARELGRHLDECFQALKAKVGSGLTDKQLKQIVILFSRGCTMEQIQRIVASDLSWQVVRRRWLDAVEQLKRCLSLKGHGR